MFTPSFHLNFQMKLSEKSHDVISVGFFSFLSSAGILTVGSFSFGFHVINSIISNLILMLNKSWADLSLV